MNNDNKNDAKQEFTGIKAIVWPIHKFELKKFLPMGFMMLCVLFIYTLVRDLKDTLVVAHATCGGAGSLGFLKLYCVMPAAILFMVIFVKLSNSIAKEKLFYVIVMFFLCFFVAFGFLLYPYKDFLHMSKETIIHLQTLHPTLHWVWPILGNWTFSIFYIMAELWGSVVLSALFWQFANEITKIKEAKRFYSLFGFIGNFGLLASGSVILFCANLAKKSAATGLTDTFGTNLRMQMGFVAVFGIILIFLYKWMQKNVLTDPNLYTPGEGVKQRSKPKLGFGASLKYLLQSKYLLKIAILVLGYGIVINLFEGIWKEQIKIRYPDSNDYNILMGKLSLVTASITIIVMLIGSNILRKFRWRTAALITPVVLIAISAIFFSLVIFENKSDIDAKFWGYAAVHVAVMVGLFGNAFGKGVKYSLFDSTMQMAYIPLDSEMKTKGQAAVSIIGGRGGKAGGAAIQSTLLLFAGGGTSLASLVNIIGSILITIGLLWIYSVCGLSREFEKKSSEKTSEKVMSGS